MDTTTASNISLTVDASTPFLNGVPTVGMTIPGNSPGPGYHWTVRVRVCRHGVRDPTKECEKCKCERILDNMMEE